MTFLPNYLRVAAAVVLATFYLRPRHAHRGVGGWGGAAGLRVGEGQGLPLQQVGLYLLPHTPHRRSAVPLHLPTHPPTMPSGPAALPPHAGRCWVLQLWCTACTAPWAVSCSASKPRQQRRQRAAAARARRGREAWGRQGGGRHQRRTQQQQQEVPQGTLMSKW